MTVTSPDLQIYSKVVALTGGIGSGKTTAARFLEKNGAVTVSADKLAHVVTAPGSSGLAAVAARFGPGILDPSGALDRKKLAAIIFSDSKARADLESITHPLIRRAAADAFIRAQNQSAPLIIYDVPLLFEAGLDKLGFKAIAVVTAPPEQIEARLLARGLEPAEIKKRIASQLPLTEKARRADFVLDNSAGLDALERRCQELFNKLKN